LASDRVVADHIVRFRHVHVRFDCFAPVVFVYTLVDLWIVSDVPSVEVQVVDLVPEQASGFG